MRIATSLTLSVELFREFTDFCKKTHRVKSRVIEELITDWLAQHTNK